MGFLEGGPELERLHTGMQFGEGPVYLGDAHLDRHSEQHAAVLLLGPGVCCPQREGGCLLAWLTRVIEAERRYPAPCPHNGGIGPGYFG